MLELEAADPMRVATCRGRAMLATDESSIRLSSIHPFLGTSHLCGWRGLRIAQLCGAQCHEEENQRGCFIASRLRSSICWLRVKKS